IQTIDSWYAQQFAYLVGRLDGFAEGDRTLLDNSATVWFQQMSDGNAANLNNLPILQAGSCGDYFKTGWAINVEGAKPDMTPGHSDEDCQNGQTPFADIEKWGTPPDVATQPINKYYCNLMNALGVKAGADGFAALGGTAPVTCFGKYDDTTLFPTDAPAIIKNPGEYPELRAS
ncbi:MAG TPA: Tat pathway signal sequence, partial [Polyangia bacterium]